jgi:hypothetical protein
MILAPVLVIGAARYQGGGPPVTYERTAFLSNTGNDATAVTNEVSRPYATLTAAIHDLAAIYPGETCTIRLLHDYALIGSDIPEVASLDGVLTAGLTVKGHIISRLFVGTFPFGTMPNAILNLDAVHIVRVAKAPANLGWAASAGTITGVGDGALIDILDVSGQSGFDGSPGANGAPVTQDDGISGGDGTPPGPGNGPPDANSSGTSGVDGSDGYRGWDITLAGALSIASDFFLSGGGGGHGGNGGSGATAIGGHGGRGGNAIDDGMGTLYDGAPGGNGGNAYANGGNGGNGGNGANGGDAYVAGTVSIAPGTFHSPGGRGGSEGGGGSAGSATPGAGGSGGFGINGGVQGADGATGAAFSNNGESGAPGSNGSNGNYINI